MVQSLINNEKVDLNLSLIKPFIGIKSDLAVSSEGIVLKNTQIVIPKSLQTNLIRVAHESHEGFEKTYQLLKRFVWFPNMYIETERFVKACRVCQTNSEKQNYEPLKMSEMPTGAWKELAADFHGPLSCGLKLFVIIDEYSSYPIVKIMNSTTAIKVITVLDDVFNIFGRPQQLKTDNGPQFIESRGIKHRKITPYWPRANGICERFMRVINRIMRNSEVTGNDWKRELEIFLRSYRATPHSTTGVAPEQLIFKTSSSSSTLPNYIELTANRSSQIEDLANEKDSNAKAQMKIRMDAKLKAKLTMFKIGEKVLVLNNSDGFVKSKPKFDPLEYVIMSINGTMVTARREGSKITRNVSFFKRVFEYDDKKMLEGDRFSPIEIIGRGSTTIELEPAEEQLEPAEEQLEPAEEQLEPADEQLEPAEKKPESVEARPIYMRQRKVLERYNNAKENQRAKELKMKNKLGKAKKE